MRLPWTSQPAAQDEPTAAPVIPSLGNGIAVPITAEMVTNLLESIRSNDLPDPGTDFYVDWAGVRTRVGMLPWAPQELRGVRNTGLPIPDDGYRSEDVEYAALAQALSTASDTFRIVEVGAGWAPWVVAGVVVARRMGLRPCGIAVEADLRRSEWALQHALDNNVRAELVTGTPEEIAAALAAPAGDIEMRVVRAAGWHSTTVLQFPDIDEQDMGAAVWTLPGTDVDYRGAHLSHHDVSTVSMETLLASTSRTDLLHVDVQGVEFELLEPSSDVIQQNVRLMAVGTTNRLVEGQLQQHFLARGWGLLVDAPSTAIFTMTHPTLSGFTVQDGNQLWENPFLRQA
ncbi:MAG: hypothetical protein PSX37_14045 [bacterium]|nr:hypothetical protein [bacterium]